MSTFTPPEIVDPTLPRIYYEGMSQTYWIEDARLNWMKINETAVKRELKHAGFSPASEFGANSECDNAIREIQRENHVLYAGALAGYDRGPCTMNGNNILITSSPEIIEPVPGEWPMLEGIIERIFKERDVYFYGWLAMAYQCLYFRSHKPGQILVIAGPTNSGKTFLQNVLIHTLLGGRTGSPYRYMTGGTTFNGDYFETESLAIGDEMAGTDIRTRMHFGKELKKIAAERVHSCHPKGGRALPMTPFWRASITLNFDGENMMVLPPIGDSMQDKFIMLEAHPGPMPMPTRSALEEELFREAIYEELPAFCAWLLDLEIPDEYADPRYGIVGWQDPKLLALLEEHSPEEKLWEIIVHALGEKSKPWEGTTQQLEEILTSTSDAAKHLLKFSSACGMYMARLAEKSPERVTKPRSRGYWRVEFTPTTWDRDQPQTPAT